MGQRFKDLTGIRYNKLIVLRNTNKKISGSYVWECVCDCGKITYASSSQLNSGKKKSCGCLVIEIATARVMKPFGEASFNSLYSRYRSGAKRRGIAFELTKEEFRVFTKNNCFYCGTEPSQVMNKSNNECNGVYIYNGIDRVDNNKGYIMENCVSCCGVCNHAKDIMGLEEFRMWIHNIKKESDKFSIEIKYFDQNMEKIKILPNGDWFDLRSSVDIELKKGEYKLIPLGVAMKLPNGFEAHIAPRSSTFKNYKVLQVNGIGIVDNSYCGDNDQWFFPAYAIEDTKISKNDRICQFRIIKKQPQIEFLEVMELGNPNRGGLGSTGKQ